MSQPIQPPPQQPLGQQPPIQPPGRPPKQKRFGFLALGIAALVGLVLGGVAFGAGDGDSTGTAAPAPTVTVTETNLPGTGGAAPTEEPSAEPEPEPTTEAAPAKWDPKPKDFKVSVKVTDKQCFGSAGCSIDYKVSLDYLGTQDLPDEGTTDITYEVSGAEDPIIGTITLDSEGKFDLSEESASTTSSSKKLVAKVTEVDYNEFG